MLLMSDLLLYKIYVFLSPFRLELEFEPLFATMALYDAKEKKKVIIRYVLKFPLCLLICKI